MTRGSKTHQLFRVFNDPTSLPRTFSEKKTHLTNQGGLMWETKLFFCAPPKHHSCEIELKAFANFDIILSEGHKHVATTAKHETCNRQIHIMMIKKKHVKKLFHALYSNSSEPT